MDRKRWFLERYEKKCDEVEIMKTRIAFINDQIYAAKHSCTEEKIRGKGETIEDKVHRKMNLEEILRKKEAERDAIYEETVAAIGKMESLRLQEILTMAFIDFLPIPQIAREIGYGRSTAYRLLDKAVAAVEIRKKS